MSGNKAIDIIESLKSTILNGGFDVSKSLPSAAALMKKFGVARGTVDRAMRELEHAGLVERRKGSGTYAIEKKPTLFGVIVPNADQPFFARICTGISNCAKITGGGGLYSLLWASKPLNTKSSIKAFAQMCVDAKVAGVFFCRTRDANLTSEILSLFKSAQIPVVLLGGDMPSGFPCDLAGINYLANGRRMRVNILSPVAYNDSTLIAHGELFGDVALRLMLQRLSYSSKHPSAEVYIDLPKPKAKKKEVY